MSHKDPAINSARVRRHYRQNKAKVLQKNREWKAKNKAHVREYMKDYRHRYKSRARTLHYSRTYGLTVAQVDAMLAAQDGACAICQTQNPSRGRTLGWFVDHDHKTRLVRGILCNNCNRAIGLMKDDPSILERAVAYLRAQRIPMLDRNSAPAPQIELFDVGADCVEF